MDDVESWIVTDDLPCELGDLGLVAIGAPVHRPKVSTHADGTLGFTVATPRGGVRHG